MIDIFSQDTKQDIMKLTLSNKQARSVRLITKEKKQKKQVNASLQCGHTSVSSSPL